jgi:hypothetical protein
MSLELHRRAEVLMGQGDDLAAKGRDDEAAAAYAAAGRAEMDAYAAIPSDRARTRGIIAVSAISLFKKARLLTEAARQAHLYLADETLTEAARVELEQLLDDVRNEQRLGREGRVLSPDRFVWTLRGPAIGHGIAKLETVLQKGEQIGHLAVRVYEYVAQLPLRTKGPADPSVREGLDVVISQPMAGSFRFTLQFSTPAHQTGMFDDQPPIEPDRLGDAFAEILSRASSLQPESMDQVVPDAGYRDAFFKLVRNLVPDGRHLSEIEVVGGAPERPSKTVLTPPIRNEITRHLEKGRTPVEKPTGDVDELRGLNLNEGWILLGRVGHERRCWVEEGVLLEDVVEGFVNRRVRVTGHWRGKKFYIDDLVEDTSE